MKKAINIILVSVAIFSVLSLSSFTVFAASAPAFTLTSFEVNGAQGAIVYTDVTSSTSFSSTNGIIRCNTDAVSSVYGYRCVLSAVPYAKVEEGYYFIFNATFDADAQTSSIGDYWFKTSVVSSNGLTYQLEPVIDYNGSSYSVTVGAKIGDGSAFSFGDLIFETNFPPVRYSTAFDVNVSISIRPQLTPEQQRHEELLDSIDQNTDKILNGYTPDDDGSKEDFDSAVGDLEDAESNLFPDGDPDSALGDVEDAFDQDPFQDLNPASSQWVSLYLTQLLGFLGKEYTALIFISCLLGIALLAIGRIL